MKEGNTEKEKAEGRDRIWGWGTRGGRRGMDGYLNEKEGKRGELASLRVWTEIGRPFCMCAISPSLGLTRPRVSKAATSQPEISKPRDRRSSDRRLAFHPVRFHTLSFLSRLHLPAPHTCPLWTASRVYFVWRSPRPRNRRAQIFTQHNTV